MPSELTSRAVEAFQSSFLDGDFTQAAFAMSDDVLFRSPVLEKPWKTKPVVDRLGPAMVSILDDVRFTYTVQRGDRACLVFTATQAGVDVEGVQVIDVDPTGKVSEFAIFIRPLRALLAVAKAMEAAVDPELLAAHTG